MIYTGMMLQSIVVCRRALGGELGDNDWAWSIFFQRVQRCDEGDEERLAPGAPKNTILLVCTKYDHG